MIFLLSILRLSRIILVSDDREKLNNNTRYGTLIANSEKSDSSSTFGHLFTQISNSVDYHVHLQKQLKQFPNCTLDFLKSSIEIDIMYCQWVRSFAS